MQVYHNIPYGKVIFYVFTILFHLYLLIRSAIESRYFITVLLVIPVTAVSLVLFKFLKKNLISVFLKGTSLELATVFDKFYSEIGETKLEGNEVLIKGRKFQINLKKANKLIQTLKEN